MLTRGDSVCSFVPFIFSLIVVDQIHGAYFLLILYRFSLAQPLSPRQGRLVAQPS